MKTPIPVDNNEFIVARRRGGHEEKYRELILGAVKEVGLTDPGNRLEKLAGDRSGQCSIRINDQWQICFEWQEGDAFRVEITDYH